MDTILKKKSLLNTKENIASLASNLSDYNELVLTINYGSRYLRDFIWENNVESE